MGTADARVFLWEQFGYSTSDAEYNNTTVIEEGGDVENIDQPRRYAGTALL